MKNAYKQKRTEGFTIIEVLIVLAIAALIFLIVFLAVPALQRNARNNGIKNDAANLLSGVSTFESNNSGQLPTGGCPGTSGTVTLSGAAGTQTNDVSIQPTTVCAITAGASGTTPSWPVATGTVNIYTNFKCTSNTAAAYNARSVAALFLVETGGSSTAKQCVES